MKGKKTREALIALLLMVVFGTGAAWAQSLGDASSALLRPPRIGMAGAGMASPGLAAASQGGVDLASGGAATTVPRLTLARASDHYPVTPGDVYELSYELPSGSAKETVIVGGNYRAALGIFGSIDARGMTFPQLQAAVQKRIAAAYPSSISDLEIASVGEFEVYLKGSVPQARYVPAWGLSRLGDILTGNLGPYSSVRRVAIQSADGQVHTFDYYMALRFGDLSDDPYVRPGDTVIVDPAGMRVHLEGAVNRPGTYELLRGEGLKQLIGQFGGGLSPQGDPSHIRIDRIAGSEPTTLYLDYASASGSATPLDNGDTVVVAPKNSRLPVVFFEGAVVSTDSYVSGEQLMGGGGSPAAQAASSQQAQEQRAAAVQAASASNTLAEPAYGRIPFSYYPGERLSNALRAVDSSILPTADLEDSYLVRGRGHDAPTQLDLEALLHDPPEIQVQDPVLTPFDRIIIPNRRFTVTVTGAVFTPGSYPYAPDKGVQYYASLAGGINSEHNSGGKAFVYDSEGKLLPSTNNGSIQPGDRIYFPNNNFFYNFNKVFPLVATSASLLASIAMILTVVHP